MEEILRYTICDKDFRHLSEADRKAVKAQISKFDVSSFKTVKQLTTHLSKINRIWYCKGTSTQRDKAIYFDNLALLKWHQEKGNK